MNQQMWQTVLSYWFYMRYIYEGDFKDEFHFWKPLETIITACDVFNKVGSYLQNHDIPWGNVCGVCTDGDPAMLAGFQRLVIRCITESHCNSLYDSSASVSNEDFAIRISR